MGASAREIEREINETRDRMDENLKRLEGRATYNAIRYGRIAAMAFGVAVVAGVAFLVFRRTRKRSLKERLDALSIDNLRELSAQLREQLPTVTLTLNDQTPQEPGTMEAIVRKVAPAVVGSLSTAVLGKIGRTGPPEAE